MRKLDAVSESKANCYLLEGSRLFAGAAIVCGPGAGSPVGLALGTFSRPIGTNHPRETEGFQHACTDPAFFRVASSGYDQSVFRALAKT